VRRWEYRVVSFHDGRYTAPLNEYGADGWELVSVVNDLPAGSTSGGGGSSVPLPGVVGRAQAAASAIDKLGGSSAAPASGPALLWILRRPLDEDE
jgi:hypothetical protein